MKEFKCRMVAGVRCLTPCPIGTTTRGSIIKIGSTSCQCCKHFVSFEHTDDIGVIICSGLEEDYYPCQWCGEPAKGEDKLCPTCHEQAMEEKSRGNVEDYLSEQKDDESERYERGDGSGYNY